MKDKLWFFASYQYQRDYQSPVGRAPGVPEQVRGGPRVRQAQLADQRQEQADVRLPRRLLPDPLRGHHLQRAHRPHHDQGRARPQPLAQRDLHRDPLGQDRTSRRGSPASTARTTPTRCRRASRGSSRATSTSTRARSRAASTPGTTATAGRRRPRSRSPTSPTSSWAEATTSSSASSSTREAATTSRLQRLHLHLRRRARLRLRLRDPGPPGGQDARHRASSSTTPSG